MQEGRVARRKEVSMTNDALLFIDANIYLDLYQTHTGKKLLAPLSEQSDRIFVTQQVVDEVIRNKIEVTAAFLSNKFAELKLHTFNVPDHLSGATQDESKAILNNMKKIHEDIEKLNQAIIDLAEGIMENIVNSTDEVSKTLDVIFARASRHTDEELKRARTRKELGNPPGKRADPLGDQISWEQILSRFAPKSKLWIISRDGDYGASYGGREFLNKFLYDELRKISPDAEAFLFKDLVDGIKDFAKTTGVEANKLPTDEEEAEIKREIEALPSVGGQAGTFSSTASLVLPSPIFGSGGPLSSTTRDTPLVLRVGSTSGLGATPHKPAPRG
jgi:hypothetical protein